LEQEACVRWVDQLGARLIGGVRYVLFLLAFLYFAIKIMWVTRHFGQRDFLQQTLLQVYFTAVQAAGSVVLLALAVGGVAMVQGVGGMGALSGADNLSRIVTVIMLRDVAPLLTGVVVIVRSVTAIAAELGVMRVQREVEALEVMGLSPLRQLVAPRLLGGLLSLFGLNVLFSAVALVGGFMIAQVLVSLPAQVFFQSVLSATAPLDIAAFALKVVVGGLGLFLIACYHGMDVMAAPSEVPVAVSRAALNALVFLVVVHGAVSLAVILNSNTYSLMGGLL
jgi:phospholipid/cholesterol/gamma-HCH transport system permease protein